MQETLPLIAKRFGKTKQIYNLTKKTIKGDIPFIESFLTRVGILGNIPEKKIDELLGKVRLNHKLLHFIKKNSKDCVVLTGNYFGWISKLTRRIPCKVLASEGCLDGKKSVKLSKILKKEEIVKSIRKNGEKVVFIGDGNNDAEAMRFADVAIACGIVHYPARSVLSLADFYIADTNALIRLLDQIKTNKRGISIVISSAGIGSRLGLGQTKALIKIKNETLIQHQLKSFSKVKDVRIVVGYQADNVIRHVSKVRTDIIFVFNHDYFQTKTGASLYLGARFARKHVIAWDGDLIVHPNDIKKCIQASEYIGCSHPISTETVFVELNKEKKVIKFTNKPNQYEWTGPACIKRDKIYYTAGHTYLTLKKYLPIKAKIIRAFDIDTYQDYEKAKLIIKNWNEKG